MPTISTTARRLRAYQATLDRRARPARPTTASRRCAPTGDGTLHALLTVLAYYWYHWYPILPYFYTVIGSIDLLASSDSPVYLHPSAVFFYPVYLTMNYATLRPLLSTCYSKKILSAIFSADPLYCYLSLGDCLPFLRLRAASAHGYRSYAQLLVDAPTASIATMLQKTSDYANQVYHSLADHDLARYV